MNIKGRKNRKFIYLVKDILIPLLSPVSGANEKATNFRRVFISVIYFFISSTGNCHLVFQNTFPFQVRELFSPSRKDFLLNVYFLALFFIKFYVNWVLIMKWESERKIFSAFFLFVKEIIIYMLNIYLYFLYLKHKKQSIFHNFNLLEKKKLGFKK